MNEDLDLSQKNDKASSDNSEIRLTFTGKRFPEWNPISIPRLYDNSIAEYNLITQEFTFGLLNGMYYAGGTETLEDIMENPTVHTGGNSGAGVVDEKASFEVVEDNGMTKRLTPSKVEYVLKKNSSDKDDMLEFDTYNAMIAHGSRLPKPEIKNGKIRIPYLGKDRFDKTIRFMDDILKYSDRGATGEISYLQKKLEEFSDMLVSEEAKLNRALEANPGLKARWEKRRMEKLAKSLKSTEEEVSENTYLAELLRLIPEADDNTRNLLKPIEKLLDEASMKFKHYSFNMKPSNASYVDGKLVPYDVNRVKTKLMQESDLYFLNAYMPKTPGLDGPWNIKNANMLQSDRPAYVKLRETIVERLIKNREEEYNIVIDREEYKRYLPVASLLNAIHAAGYALEKLAKPKIENDSGIDRRTFGDIIDNSTEFKYNLLLIRKSLKEIHQKFGIETSELENELNRRFHDTYRDTMPIRVLKAARMWSTKSEKEIQEMQDKEGKTYAHILTDKFDDFECLKDASKSISISAEVIHYETLEEISYDDPIVKRIFTRYVDNNFERFMTGLYIAQGFGEHVDTIMPYLKENRRETIENIIEDKNLYNTIIGNMRDYMMNNLEFVSYVRSKTREADSMVANHDSFGLAKKRKTEISFDALEAPDKTIIYGDSLFLTPADVLPIEMAKKKLENVEGYINLKAA